MNESGLPTDGYLFLDTNRPHVAWATYRGVLITPPNTRTSTGRFLSWWQTDLHRNSPHIAREAALEQIRRQKYPEKISRLNGLFCFLDWESAAMACDQWNEHFKLENLAEINLKEARGRDRLDANWITYADPASTLPSDEWIQRYWEGEPYPGTKPIWETIVEGKATVLGTDLRTRAYETVKVHWPNSLMQLEISRLGAWLDSDIGCISAFVTEDAENYYFKFFMDMRDADNTEFLDRLRLLMDSGHPINRADIEPHYKRGSFGNVPDMRGLEFSCPKDMTLTADTW